MATEYLNRRETLAIDHVLVLKEPFHIFQGVLKIVIRPAINFLLKAKCLWRNGFEYKLFFPQHTFGILLILHSLHYVAFPWGLTLQKVLKIYSKLLMPI